VKYLLSISENVKRRAPVRTLFTSIDTGRYVKTGDWEVNGDRFPKGIRRIVDMLEERGMKLGLWFNPTVAAASSRAASRSAAR